MEKLSIICTVLMQDMIYHVNTLDTPPWGGVYQFSEGLIREIIENGTPDPRPWDSGIRPMQMLDIKDELYHARRVAYLVVNRSEDPISIDVGVPSLYFTPDFLIQDGCHRLAAAIYRKDQYITVDYAGSVELFEEMFPSAVQVYISGRASWR